ncbi:uncharacterized protein LOC107612763 isoform X3 [Arachis ipaensis]|uniref:uncharacterized protein LOC107612763 isoform X3 n=1 Tax=Arachis ipaensis TaxID=130454 RepID=UPI0007AF82C0|nr:uncharacterized protein LOC107612763 isoform X3 [Arachis ipaensis]
MAPSNLTAITAQLRFQTTSFVRLYMSYPIMLLSIEDSYNTFSFFFNKHCMCFLFSPSFCFLQETAHWTVLPFIRDSFCMIGYAIGATTSAFYGFNNGTTCDSVLFCLCRIRRWGCSFLGTTCILILSCSILSSCLTSAIDG